MLTPDADDSLSLARVLTRSAVDPEYRRWLLADPHAAIAEVTGVTILSSVRIQVIEQPADVDSLIVLPPRIESGSG
jgi:hypothetical protein